MENAFQGKRGTEKERRWLQFLGLLKALAVKHRRTEKKKNLSSNKAEDKLLPFLHAFGHSTSLRSYLPAEALTKAQFFIPFLYQIHCIGPIGFGFIHIYNEGPPKSRPYNWRNLWEELVC